MRYLIAVIDHGGVRRAAEHLNIAQPAVGRQIRLLETTLKVPLLTRKGRNVVPTPAALELADRARGWLREIERTGHDLKLEAAGKRGRLIIGYSDDVLHGEISRSMTQFISTHPQVDVELKFGLTSDLAADVSRQLIDCAIIGG
ncbi:MAG: LysR family transcriptional regulator, partial [Pseudomonadota bacterium]